MKKYEFYVYILQCSDGTYYTGVTNNLNRRLSEHKNGEASEYTKQRLPVKLMRSFVFNDIREAIAFEKQVKGWSRKKKEALIQDDWQKVSKYSKTSKSHTSTSSV